eukprot:scaffold651401_cov34-Prasinocladus_malaysianus.AAC.1
MAGTQESQALPWLPQQRLSNPPEEGGKGAVGACREPSGAYGLIVGATFGHGEVTGFKFKVTEGATRVR